MRTLEEWKEENRVFDGYREILYSNPDAQEDIEYQGKLAVDFLKQIFDGQRQVCDVMLTKYGIDYTNQSVTTLGDNQIRHPRVVYPERIPDKADKEGWEAFLFAIMKAGIFDEAARAAEDVIDEAPPDELICTAVVRAAQEAFRITQREPAGYLAIMKAERVPEFDDLPEGLYTWARDALRSFIPTQVQLSSSGKNRRLQRALDPTGSASRSVVFQRFWEHLSQVLPKVAEEYKIEEPVRPGKKERISKKKRNRSLVSRAVTEIDRMGAPLKEQVFEPQRIEEFTLREAARIRLRGSGQKVSLPGSGHNKDESSITETMKMKHLFSKLSKRQREVILLDHEGYTDQEIAERLDISAGSVKRHLSRARKNIEKLKKSS